MLSNSNKDNACLIFIYLYIYNIKMLKLKTIDGNLEKIKKAYNFNTWWSYDNPLLYILNNKAIIIIEHVSYCLNTNKYIELNNINNNSSKANEHIVSKKFVDGDIINFTYENEHNFIIFFIYKELSNIIGYNVKIEN